MSERQLGLFQNDFTGEVTDHLIRVMPSRDFIVKRSVEARTMSLKYKGITFVTNTHAGTNGRRLSAERVAEKLANDCRLFNNSEME